MATVSSAAATTGLVLVSIRVLCYSMIGYSLFYLAMFLGKWYEAEVLDDEFKFTLKSELEMRSSTNQKAVFLLLPVVLAASLGGVYEAIWKRREGKGNKANITIQEKQQHQESPSPSSKYPGAFTLLLNAVHYQFRPLGKYSPWLSVGECTVLFLWVVAMGAQCWQAVMNHGNHFYHLAEQCADDSSKWCFISSGEIAPTPTQYRLSMVAVFMGIVASSHFAVILIPVSRDSKIWSSLGIPFERAVLYHAIAGHLAFAATFMHAFLFVVFWVWEKGWSHMWFMSTNVDRDTHGGVDTPMGWLAGLCALPMWITSGNYVRRRWYSLFKAAHWLFIGVLFFGAMHYAPNALYYMGGLTLYTVHVMSRLSAWKRWRYWNRWWNPAAPATPTSLVSLLTSDTYTRLVLKNPKSGEPARGGSFVYISVPGALGTDEAHAITVALRGAPPAVVSEKNLAYSSTSPRQDGIFTVYVKDLGPWTSALRLTVKGAEAAGGPESVLVDVDGFYTHVDSFNSMMQDGISRVVVIAGGSGVTSVMGFIHVVFLFFFRARRDWCVAASSGANVPEVRLAWCCRDMHEMELVGESLPSMLATTGGVKDTHFTLSLYCSSKADSSGEPLSVTWALDSTTYAGGDAQELVMGKTPVMSSLNHSVRVLLAGGAAYAGFLLGMYEADRRDVMNVYHEGAVIMVLVIVCIVSVLIVYGWLGSFWSSLFVPQDAMTTKDARGRSVEESKLDLESSSTRNTATYKVTRGRVPITDLLNQEAEMAKKNGAHSVKVLVSGPSSLVDTVLIEARTIDWQLFDAEAFSFEF